jgi:hypothetical protein
MADGHLAGIVYVKVLAELVHAWSNKLHRNIVRWRESLDGSLDDCGPGTIARLAREEQLKETSETTRQTFRHKEKAALREQHHRRSNPLALVLLQIDALKAARAWLRATTSWANTLAVLWQDIAPNVEE